MAVPVVTAETLNVTSVAISLSNMYAILSPKFKLVCQFYVSWFDAMVCRTIFELIWNKMFVAGTIIFLSPISSLM